MNETEKKAKAANDPIQNLEYMLHNPIQYPVHSPQLPNTFTNKESVAQEDSLHNQLKNFIHCHQLLRGEGRGY